MSVAYWIDPADRIVAVNEAWDAFARANSGEEVLADAVIGQPLRRYIADATTASIYHRLFERARGSSRPVTITFRCDSPGERRLFEMSLTRAPERLIAAKVRALDVKPRAPILVLSATCARSGDWVRMCGWCHRVDGGGDAWIELEEAIERLAIFHRGPPPRVTHAVCEPCTERLQRELDTLAPAR